MHSHLVKPLINSGPNGYEDMIKMEYVIQASILDDSPHLRVMEIS